MLEYIAFLSCLQFAVLNSIYCCTVLKPRQVICLESIYLKKDVLCVLPTGYGKSLVFHLLPGLLFAKEKLDDVLDDWKSKGIAGVTTIVVVVSPLNALMSNQIARLNLSGIRASVLNVKEATEMKDAAVSLDDDGSVVDVFNCDFRLCEEHKLRLGYYHIVFSHPESFISTRYGRMLLQSKPYQDNICAIVIDEAHCILECSSMSEDASTKRLTIARKMFSTRSSTTTDRTFPECPQCRKLGLQLEACTAKLEETEELNSEFLSRNLYVMKCIMVNRWETG